MSRSKNTKYGAKIPAQRKANERKDQGGPWQMLEAMVRTLGLSTDITDGLGCQVLTMAQCC
jgi:hypothetical protein